MLQKLNNNIFRATKIKIRINMITFLNERMQLKKLLRKHLYENNTKIIKDIYLPKKSNLFFITFSFTYLSF